MTERRSDSIAQFSPDGITVQYKSRDGQEVVWEDRVTDIPQWRRRFDRSPILPEGVMVDTTHVNPGDENSHIEVRAPQLGKETLQVTLDKQGTGVKELTPGVEVVVDAQALTRKFKGQATMSGRSGILNRPQSTAGTTMSRRRGW